MSRANVASVLLAIYAAKKIADCRTPELRYAPKTSNVGDNVSKLNAHWTQRAIRSIRFVLSVIGVRDVAVMCTIVAALIGRALLRLKLLTVSTSVENSVMTSNETSFWKNIRTFAMYVIPTSFSYAAFNYLLSELAINVRSTVTTRLLSKFTTDKVYFQVINATQLQSILPDQTPLSSAPNPDQILTNDIEHFSYALSGLFSHVMRPIVDILINAQRLYTTGGAIVPAVMGIYLVVTSNILNYIRSPVTQFTDREQSLEGEYRSLIARVATSAEEIAALEGGKNEEANVLQSLHPLLEYSRKFAQFRCNMSFIDAVVARYWLMMLGWRIVGMHFFSAHRRGVEDKEFLFRDYQNMSKTMLALSNAVGELIMSGRDVVKVFAYAEKLSQFEETLDELIRRSEAAAAESSTASQLDASRPKSTAPQGKCDGGSPCAAENVRPAFTLPSALSFPELGNFDNSRAFTSSDAECIILDNVSIVPPNGGSPLHTGLNIKFQRHMHTVITGENGAGKSSLLRVLAGIWPPGRGRVLRPTQQQQEASSPAHGTEAAARGSRSRIPVLYLPQTPYMTMGTLRQQIVYPEILGSDADRAGLDRLLLSIISKVHLGHLMQPTQNLSNSPAPDSPASPAGSRQAAGAYTLDTVVDWSEVLSGGEKQRLSLARLFYHRPVFALLDESTSAVSAEVEEALLAACIHEVGCTLITITHRPQIVKFHQYELRLMKDDHHVLVRLQPEEHSH